MPLPSGKVQAALRTAKYSDTERLDWLAATIGREPLQISWNNDYVDAWQLCSPYILSSGKSLRKAIDVAMQMSSRKTPSED